MPQPSRALAFGVGYAITIYMALQVILHFLWWEHHCRLQLHCSVHHDQLLVISTVNILAVSGVWFVSFNHFCQARCRENVSKTVHAWPLPFISLSCSHFIIVFTAVFWVEVFNTLCGAKMEKVNTSVILYCLSLQREEKGSFQWSDWLDSRDFYHGWGFQWPAYLWSWLLFIAFLMQPKLIIINNLRLGICLWTTTFRPFMVLTLSYPVCTRYLSPSINLPKYRTD